MFYRKRCYNRMQKGDITIQEMKNKLQQGAILLDVRSPQEYNEGHIQGAINIPEYEIKNRVEKEILMKNQLIVLYCENGGRSRSAYIEMRKMGFSNVWNLYGGLNMI